MGGLVHPKTRFNPPFSSENACTKDYQVFKDAIKKYKF